MVAEGDRVVSREEVVELADAVAPFGGIASGMGTTMYGAQILVEADTSDEAVELAVAIVQRAAATAGLPVWPIGRVETIGEDDDPEADA